MEFNFTSIKQFFPILGQDNATVIILGMGDDGWMYEYQSENGCWNRLSKAFPKSIHLPGSEAKDINPVVVEAEVKEEAPAPAPEAPAPEAAPTA